MFEKAFFVGIGLAIFLACISASILVGVLFGVI